MPAYDVSGKTALVTGAARGIGEATARALAARGANVVIVDLEQEAAERAAAAIHDTRALGLGADVTDRAAMQRVVAATVERFGGLDVVVANAGIAPRGATMRAMTTEAFDRVLDVNSGGVVRTIDAALPEVVRNGGHVVVISSVYAFMNGLGVAPYAMSKAAVEALGRTLRVELAEHGASATVAYFGFIDTEMVRRGFDDDPVAAQMAATTPRVLQKRIPPSVAGEAIAVGIETRAATVMRPRRWRALWLLRGLVNPLLDEQMRKRADAQAIVRELDGRGDEEQPTTA